MSVFRANLISPSLRRLFPLAILPIALLGCEIKDFVSQRYENSVAYFNTYYNASHLFDEAMMEIKATDENQRRLGLPPQQDISPTVRQKLTTVIEKCSKLILNYPTSKWIDDALLLIGKSYFYQGEYSKAGRKFAELLATFPESKGRIEAQLWLGKSLRRGNETDQALKELRSLVEEALKESRDEAAAEALLNIGEINLGRGAYDEAISAYQEIIERTDYDELKPQAQFKIGEVYEKTGDYRKAEDAFQRTLGLKPDNYLRYQATARSAISARKLGNYDESLTMLYSLLDDPGNQSFFPQIKLEIAHTLAAKGDLRSAILGYEIIDTTYARTDVSAKGFYHLGLIYEKELRQYAAAETNYVRSAREFPGSDVYPLAIRRAENLRRYFSHRESIWKSDKSLLKEFERRTEAKDPTKVPRVDPTSPSSNADTSHVEHSGKDSIPLTSENHAAEMDRGRESEPHPREGIEVKTREGRPSHRRDTTWVDSTLVADTVHTLHFDLWETAKGAPTLDSIRLSLARSTYDLSTLFLLDLEEPDSALFWCEKTVIVSPDSVLAARALFTMAEVYRGTNPGDSSIVGSLYKRIALEYPATQYGLEAKRILRWELGEERDSAAVVYRNAERLIEGQRGIEAIQSLQNLIRRYPRSEFAPKAQYAIGWVYEHLLSQRDSAVVNYERLAKRYPGTKYVAQIGPRLAEAEAFQAAEKAKHDSTVVPSDTLHLQPESHGKIDSSVVPDTTHKNILPEEEDLLRLRKGGQDRLRKATRPKPDSTEVIKE
jgi:tetratricopeptide (TPR) repeat protein